MFLLACVGYLAAVQAAACSTQSPPVTQCPGLHNLAINITNVSITDAKLGSNVQINATAAVKEVAGVSPVLRISFANSNGKKLPCIPSVFPCLVKTCNGTTWTEKMNAQWNSKCPLHPGFHTLHLTFHLLKNTLIKAYLGTGNIVATLSLVDNGKTLSCVAFPITFKVD